jgi:hypothetical protein
MRIPTTILPALTASPFHPFFYISRLALSDNTYRHKAATTRQPYAHSFLSYFSPSFMLTSSLYPIPDKAEGQRACI